jgi:hypothetical protein
MTEITKMKISDVRVVTDLYPRIKEDSEAISRYRDSIEQLPPIVVARDGILVDGFHRVQAHKLENIEYINVENLGDISDNEIFNEAIRRNSSHGQQLSQKDKRVIAKKLWRTLVHLGDSRKGEIGKLLSISERSVESYTKDARDEEKEEREQKAIDMWLNCHTQEDIAEFIGVPQRTLSDWISGYRKLAETTKPPTSLQTFDVWNFKIDKEDNSGYFGQMPPQVVENLLWLYTNPGDVIFDPFSGAGTTIRVAKEMGRRVWGQDRKIFNDLLPIHQHNIVKDGFPKEYTIKDKPTFVLLDPPYWIQAKGRYSDDADDLANMTLDNFISSWNKVVKTCYENINPESYIAYIVSPVELKEENKVVDLAWLMGDAFNKLGLKQPHRRIIVTYSTQQATGQQVNWAKDNKKLLKLYRDLVVFRK